MTPIQRVLERFIESDEFKPAVISATRAGYKGESYKVELFEDGTWRVLWSEEIGNRYESPGVLVPIPTLSDECPEEFLDDCFDNNVGELEEDIRLYLVNLIGVY